MPLLLKVIAFMGGVYIFPYPLLLIAFKGIVLFVVLFWLVECESLGFGSSVYIGLVGSVCIES